MKLVTAISTAALVLLPAAGLAQESPNNEGNAKDQPGLMDKVKGAISGRSAADANKSNDRDTAAKGDTNYPDRGAIKRTDK
jgi:hypothetical protein